MLLSSYNNSHDPQQQLGPGCPGSGIDCFDDQLQQQQQQDQMLVAGSGGPPGLANCSMQDHHQHHHHLKNPPVPSTASDPQQQQQQQASPGGARALRIKPQPNQVLKCPRCNSLNTKFCYYNNYSLTQPRHFCKNCRRYWTKGGALRNVPVGGGCRKNKRAKQKNPSDIHQGSSVSASDKSSVNSFGSPGGDPLAGTPRAGQLLASSSGLFDLKDPDGPDQGMPGLAFTRIPHSLRLGDHGSSSGGGLSFEIPSLARSFGAMPILPAFDAPGSAGLSTGTLNFQGLMKHEGGGGGEFTPIYDPSLNLLGGGGGGPAPAPPVSSGEASLSGFTSLGLENFVGLGLNGDLKSWRQQQQQKIQASLEDHQDHSPGSQGIHHSLLHLGGGGGGGGDHHGKGKGLGQDQSDWQGAQSQQNQNQNQGQQESSFMEPTGDGGGYWNSSGWPIDLPIYVDHHQQYCDVKPVDHSQGVVVPDFYSSRSRCAPPSLT